MNRQRGLLIGGGILLLIAVVMGIAATNNNTSVKKGREKEVNYAELYLDRYIYGNFEDKPEIEFSDVPSDFSVVVGPLKEKIQSDTKLSNEQIDKLFELYYESVKQKTSFDANLKKTKKNSFTYTVGISGISLKELSKNLKETEKGDDVYLYFSNVISQNKSSNEQTSVDLTFKKENGKISLASNYMAVVKLYMAFYIGETDVFSIKKMMEEFQPAK
ncbi:hypothetical protein [Enterococcus sp. CWB-B31]|uniref:hypothetical protein n=1 Tax=Enterococcus sp. CWB-B31 TaxID=2885159 RepID=UPI001E59E988|nr:hypothetical protein [Enterococcus sp. CWB-B31]MCB5954603.1 hypothetical protein [Enterococcus sp. CWB-B31]